jgi:RimJ/RimL family protein N-acetyltransferase
MRPVDLTTSRLVLDQPRLEDADRITEYCNDETFERFMATPWPYELKDAVAFVQIFVHSGWAEAKDFNWAMRRDGEFLGMLGVRKLGDGVGNIGYWLGAPHRGHGYAPEAVDAVLDWVFGADVGVERVHWEAVVGNTASLRIARSRGFRYTGEETKPVPARGGREETVWTAELARGARREPRGGWPL